MYPEDEESGTKYSEEDRLRDTTSQASIISPIKISDSQHKIALLDISNNKKWIAYVTYRFDTNTGNLETVPDSNNKKRMFLTRSRFTAKDQNTEDDEEFAYSGDPVDETTELDCTSCEITDDVEDGGALHCKFLSISHDGKYVVLSFLERNFGNNNRLKAPSNPNCLIFEVRDNVFKLAHRIECKGRAVFLSKKEYSLAIISPNTVKVYADFPKSQSVSYMFDLRPFRTTTKHLHERVDSHRAFIEKASWLDLSNFDSGDEMKRLITFTRHIRHNILTTPFNGGIVRIWSIIEDGTRLTSFPAKNQHIMAFSKNFKYAAAYVENSRSINVYNVKSGLLVYKLESRDISDPENFTVSHIRFCYDGRYIAMSGWEGNKVSFEVWYVEAERSIYRTLETVIEKPPTDSANGEDNTPGKIISPFVSRGIKNRRKCLKGYYTSYPNGEMTTMCVELNIDEEDEGFVEWNKETIPLIKATIEIENSLQNSKSLKSGIITIGGNKYLLRFGKNTVQLWNVSPDSGAGGLIHEDDKLLYIRAYKGPDYGLDYSFRETWKIHTFESIRFIKGEPLGRMLVNITEKTDEDGESGQKESKTYHTEEIFLPLEELLPSAPTEEISSKIINGGALRFDYHKLESACQALHFLYNSEDDASNAANVTNREVYDTNLATIRRKTEDLIRFSLNLDIKSNYFSTIAGSRTLAMLASFETGREVIKSIVVRSIPISIFSYARSRSEINKDNPQETEEDRREREEYENFMKVSNQDFSTDHQLNESTIYEMSEETNRPIVKRGELSYRSAPLKEVVETPDDKIIASNENVLTVLIDELSYTLYKLLFNRILSDSKKLGPGCLSSLTDALLFLQEGGNSDLLLLSSQKLSYLEIKKEKLGILNSEISQVIKVKELRKEYISSIRNLETHATMEQIKKHDGRFSIQLYHIKKGLKNWAEQTMWIKTFTVNILFFYRNKIRNPCRKLFLESKKEAKKLSKVCVVPLPHFNSYSNFPEDRPKNINYGENNDAVIPYKPYSAFIRVALDQHENNMFRQGDTVLEVLLEYKWQNFVRNRFIAICLIHAAYYISYCTGVLFAPELYDIVPGEGFVLENAGQIVSIVLMFICLVVLVVQEFRQFLNTHDKIDYIFSGYNWVDICAYTFPVITFVQLLCGWDSFSEVSSVATLILWTHAILRLRVISHFGITLETIIQLSKSIASVLFVMLLVIFAFTQSYIVLLRLNPDEYFQDNFDGSFAGTAESGTGEITTEGTVGFAASSADNGFADWFKAFYQVWLFIYGVWDPIIEGDVGDSKMVMALSIVFSLITVLIFFNMVIALMSSTVEDVKARGKKVWVSHFAAVVSEIELLWCRKGTKHSRKNNPTYIYYIANYDSVLRHEEKLQEETKELIQKLNISFLPYAYHGDE